MWHAKTMEGCARRSACMCMCVCVRVCVCVCARVSAYVSVSVCACMRRGGGGDYFGSVSVGGVGGSSSSASAPQRGGNVTQPTATTLCQIGLPRGAEALGPAGTSTQRIAASERVQFTNGLPRGGKQRNTRPRRVRWGGGGLS